MFAKSPFCAAIVGIFLSLSANGPARLIAQGSTQQPTIQQQAVSAVIKQIIIDPFMHVPKTGTALSPKGSWFTGKEPPSGCPIEAQCVTVIYKVPEQEVLCQWIVSFGVDSQSVILDQNEEATRYTLRKPSPDQVKPLVLSRKTPDYPPIAMAAHVGGKVTITVSISASGVPDHILSTDGPAMLKGSAIDAVGGWAFKLLTVGSQSARYVTDIVFDSTTNGLGSAHIQMKP